MPLSPYLLDNPLHLVQAFQSSKAAKTSMANQQDPILQVETRTAFFAWMLPPDPPPSTIDIGYSVYVVPCSPSAGIFVKDLVSYFLQLTSL